MKKRKERDVEDEEIPQKKSKVSGFAEGKENNNKPADLVRTVKSLLHKEQTRLSGLTKLLNALKESQNKEKVDGIVKEAGEFQEVFKILEGGRHNLSQLEIQKCLEILESVLLFTAEDVHFSTRTGMVIVQRVLQNHMKILYTCLNPGNPPDVIKAALRLLTAMVTQGTSAAREVQRSFDFTLKSIGPLLNKRDKKSVQDVRTCFIYFCLSFLMFGDLAVMKQILELKGFLQSVMKGLQFDSPNVVHAVLTTLQTRVVQNAGITKKTKVQFFNSYVLSQLATLYQYTKNAEEESRQTVRQQVHELLLKICGSFKFGICFSNTMGVFVTRSNNPVLLRFLQNTSSMTSDVCIQELVTKVLCCCQDVLKPFLSSLSAMYEPRLSMPWVANMNLVTKIYMALPQPSHMVEKSGLKVTVELLPSLINMVIPVGISRTVLNRGVQHASSLVKHAILSLLVVILERAQNAAGCLASKGSSAINLENRNAQVETTLLQQFREEVLKGLPDVKTVISLKQNLTAGNTKEESATDAAGPTILLAQCLKVILGFQTLWPSVLSHINFDLKKLLPAQQEMNSPPITQQLTLQILLQAPAGTLKWYQQRGKSSVSFVYSILSLFTLARSEDIKNNAKQLLWKLLRETGLASNDASEVDIWLTQLQQSQMQKGHEETLLRFLDEVFTAVAAEPHVYTDIIIDMQAEVVAAEATVTQHAVDAEWNMSSDTSLPVSLLLVGALKRYTEMVCEISEPVEKTAVRNIGCIARYMNCVIFNMIHLSMNPTILSFVICHYYGNTVIPEYLMAMRSLHKAVPQYVRCWLPGANQDKLGYFETQVQRNDEDFNKLQTFLKKTVVNTEQAKVTASAELYHLLEPLDEVQLSAAIVDCVEFCKHKLSADFVPLVEVLKVKNYKIRGVTSTESISPLLQALPFSVIMWQVFGESIQDKRTSLQEIQEDSSSFENDISIPVPSSWIQSLLLTALEKEPASKSISHCHHLLLYLRSLKTKLTTVCDSLEQGRLQSLIQLGFQLLQYLIQRSVSQLQDLKEGGTNLLGEKTTRCLNRTTNSSHGTCEPDLCDVEDMCRQVLHHPVILNCFLWKPEQSMAYTICKNVSVQLTYDISNLLLVLLPGLSLQQKHMLMGPFIRKLYSAGRMEIQSAQVGNAGSSSQALYLLGLFRDFCDDENRAHFISSLSELPSNMLVTADSASGEAVPSVFLLTLLTFLDFETYSEGNLSNSSSAFLRSIELKTEEPLAVAHFKQLIKISEDVNCPQLDTAILRLLQKSLMYVLASTTTLLDSCIDYPTEAKIAVAAHLVARSPALRSHFELRCLGRPSSKKIKSGTKTSPIEFKDHLKEFLPLVSSYLFCVHGMERDTSGETRAKAVISHVVEVYWTPLWEWLSSDRERIFKSSEERCMELLIVLIQSVKRDDALRKMFLDLLSKASLWDMCRFRISYQLLTRLCHECSTSEEKIELTRKFCFACMEFLSSLLGEKGDKNDDEDFEFQDVFAHLELICKQSSPLSASNDSCVSTWNSFVTSSLRFKFKSAHVLRTLRCIIQALYKEEAGDKCLSCALLPLDTLYEMVLSHSQFLEVILDDEEAGKRDLKEVLTELMVTVVEKSPACCQSSHLPVLFAAYSASLSATDQPILYLLNLYEKNNASFRNYRPILWGPAAASHHQIAKSLGPSLWQQPSVTEVLEQLDASKMNQSAVVFPQNRHLQPQVQHDLSDQKLQDVYDPCFLLPLFSCLLAPNYQVDCRKFVEQGCLSFTITSLSSRDAHVRQAGYHVLSRFMTHLEGARFKERKQIFHLLKCLKNGITEANCRISSVMVCFVARVVYILLKAEHPFYVMMNSYLLQRPALDLRDLPMFYSMFNSSTMQHKTERSWMLQLLVDGMKDSPDYYLYKRRHVIELALSYHDSPVSDQHSQTLVAQLLLSAVKIHPAAYDLAKNYGVIAWIHSLCYKSPKKVDTCLDLLYTLWFTLHRGHVEKRTEAASSKDEKDIDKEEKAVRLPPNVAQECTLVCWTLLEQLGSYPGARDTCSFLELLASITSYLTTNKQDFGLSRDRILSLLHLWCAAFDETCAVNQLLSSFSLKEICRLDAPLDTDGDYSNLKADSLSSLLSILTTWEPSSSAGAEQTMLLMWRFGLSCSDKSSVHNTPGSYRLQSNEIQTSVPFLSILRWFRKCLVRNRALQDRLVTESPALEIKAILPLYQFGLSSERTALLKHREDRGSRMKFRFAVLRELNMICLVLFAAVRRIQQGSDSLTSPQTGVFQLISQEPYADCITNGLEKVILPLLSDPSRNLEEAVFQDQDVILQELISLFTQELWMEKPIPHQFLSFILSHSDSGCPVVDSLIQELGGTKVITKWTQKQTV